MKAYTFVSSKQLVKMLKLNPAVTLLKADQVWLKNDVLRLVVEVPPDTPHEETRPSRACPFVELEALTATSCLECGMTEGVRSGRKLGNGLCAECLDKAYTEAISPGEERHD